MPGYLDQCTTTHFMLKGKLYVAIIGPCVKTGKIQTRIVEERDYHRYLNGEQAQNCFPYLSNGEREFIISGFSGEAWSLTFDTKFLQLLRVPIRTKEQAEAFLIACIEEDYCFKDAPAEDHDFSSCVDLSDDEAYYFKHRILDIRLLGIINPVAFVAAYMQDGFSMDDDSMHRCKRR